MAERTPPSNDFIAQYNDLWRQMREVQRRLLDENAFPLLQTFENGTPLGDTLGINFGAGIRATLTDNKYIEVTGSAGGGSYLDALVDQDGFAASNTNATPPEFRGIGEAMDYLDSLGLVNCVIGVRGSTTTYDEAADWNSPFNVRLIALRAGGSLFGQGGSIRPVIWDWNDFQPNIQINLQVEGFADFTPHSFGASPGALFSNLYLIDSGMSITAQGGTAFLCSKFMAVASNVDVISDAGTVRLASSDAMFYDTDILTNVSLGGSYTFIPVGTSGINPQLFIGASRWGITSSSGTLTVTLPLVFDIDVNESPRRMSSTTVSDQIILTVPSSGAGRIRAGVSGTAPHFVVNATSAFDTLDLDGPGVLAGTINGAHHHLVIRGGVQASAITTLTGPALLDILIRSTGSLALGGEGISGHVSAEALTGSTTLLSFFACDRASLLVSADPTGSTRRPYAFDASSDRNVLVFHGLDSGWVAGTDAGTLNRVLPEGTTPFSGVSGHVIEDEGTPLTQRANLSFVGAGVTVTDSAPDTIVTIAGGATFGSPVESQFGDTGADGVGTDAARDDHVHDRHDDAVLFYSGIN